MTTSEERLPRASPSPGAAVFPLTIIAVRHPGMADGAPYLAFREQPGAVNAVFTDPKFFTKHQGVYGRGDTPDEALHDLIDRLQHPETALFRVLVAGSRVWQDTRMIFEDLDGLLARHPGGLAIVHGGCRRGADQIAHAWCLRHRDLVVEEIHPVTAEEWERLGPRAGPLRNQRMANLGADMMIAWVRGISPGTRNCIRMAQDMGIPVRMRQAGLG